MGFCKRSFHEECRKKVEQEGLQCFENFNGKIDITELSLDSDLLKGNLNTSWTCDDCSNNFVACLICKNKGLYYGAEYKKNKKGKSKKDEDDDITGKNAKKKN